MITNQDKSTIEYSAKKNRVPLGRTFYGVILFGTQKELDVIQKEEAREYFYEQKKSNS